MGEKPSFDSGHYWERRYRSGRTSGTGSYGRLAEFKAAFINKFYQDNNITTHIDFGVGDGNQLSLLNPKQYVGVDVSRTTIVRLRERFAAMQNYSFFHVTDLDGVDRCELASSIDVVFHLVEDQVFENYMRRLFLYARRFVIIYSSNDNTTTAASHVRHRRFTDFISANIPDWQLVQYHPNPYPFNPTDEGNTSFCDFFVFAPTGGN